ncbi:OLC1v1025746C1 [Oldenlandia corymbosa var. corymbosa]|uniref:OLC1v1025746C1 n=1 Tax=Oldenlandia corymbosa var. corymbosa TaxID=529605 RepID=A0AAV1C611_OLDCO|nr:OLC1v1025746C1 [Oldenlandia corymbosa var. corymbosa]
MATEEDLANIIGRLSLREGESARHFTSSLTTTRIDPLLTVVARLHYPRIVSHDSIATHCRNIWSIHHGFAVRPLGENMVHIKFNDRIDRARVLHSEPWLLGRKYPLVLKPFDDVNGDFDLFPWWIHLYNCPLDLMNEEFSAFTGNKIGKFMEMYTDADRNFIGRFLRIKVGVNLKEPLMRVLQFKHEANDPDPFFVPDDSDEEVAPRSERQFHRMTVFRNQNPSHPNTSSSQPTRNHHHQSDLNIPSSQATKSLSQWPIPSHQNNLPPSVDLPPLIAPSSSSYVNPHFTTENIPPSTQIQNSNSSLPNASPGHTQNTPSSPSMSIPHDHITVSPPLSRKQKDSDLNLLSPFLVSDPMTLDTPGRKAAHRFMTACRKALQNVSGKNPELSSRVKGKLLIDDYESNDLQTVEVEVIGKKARVDHASPSTPMLETYFMDGGAAVSGLSSQSRPAQ